MSQSIETKTSDLLTELHSTRSAIREVQAQEKDLKMKQRELESQIAIKLQQEGIDKVSNDVCTLSLKAEVVPTVEDWDQFFEYLKETGQFELMQKRMSATAYRELIAMGVDIPGVKSTELTRINFRSL
tara:strand:- start:4066 stop:4449 length:384 start_codon:yes stop_codon:yes gene_type:complete